MKNKRKCGRFGNRLIVITKGVGMAMVVCMKAKVRRFLPLLPCIADLGRYHDIASPFPQARRAPARHRQGFINDDGSPSLKELLLRVI